MSLLSEITIRFNRCHQYVCTLSVEEPETLTDTEERSTIALKALGDTVKKDAEVSVLEKSGVKPLCHMPEALETLIRRYLPLQDAIALAKTARSHSRGMNNDHPFWSNTARSLGLVGTFPSTNTKLAVQARVEKDIFLVRNYFPMFSLQVETDLNPLVQLRAFRKISNTWIFSDTCDLLHESRYLTLRLSGSTLSESCKANILNQRFYVFADLAPIVLRTCMTTKLALLNYCSEETFKIMLRYFSFSENFQGVLTSTRTNIPQALQWVIDYYSKEKIDFSMNMTSHVHTIMRQLLEKSIDDSNFLPIIKWFSKQFPLVKLNDTTIATIKNHERLNRAYVEIIRGEELSPDEWHKHFGIIDDLI